jgi:hypothetical protein
MQVLETGKASWAVALGIGCALLPLSLGGGVMLAPPAALSQEAKKEPSRTTMASLLKKGFEVRAVMAQRSELLGDPGVVLQKGGSIFVCRRARLNDRPDVLFQADPGGPPPPAPEPTECSQSRVD